MAGTAVSVIGARTVEGPGKGMIIATGDGVVDCSAFKNRYVKLTPTAGAMSYFFGKSASDSPVTIETGPTLTDNVVDVIENPASDEVVVPSGRPFLIYSAQGFRLNLR